MIVVFTYRVLEDDSYIFLMLYVDDMLYAIKNMNDIDRLKSLLSSKFDMKDFRLVKEILGMEINRGRKDRKLWMS